MSKPYRITREKFLSKHEQEYLVKVLEQDPLSRNSIMFTLLLTYGMRQGELLATTVKDFDQRDGSLFVRGLKGSRDREFPLSTKIKSRLKKLVAGRRPEERIFPISKVMAFHVWDFIRPNKKPLHSLRHTAAINLYRKTKDIHFVSRVLGHVNIRNTMVYQDFCYTQDEFREYFED